jgi:hypothetical protein
MFIVEMNEIVMTDMFICLWYLAYTLNLLQPTYSYVISSYEVSQPVFLINLLFHPFITAINGLILYLALYNFT